MKKTILITGSTDGIGLATARLLASRGHEVLLHGRSGDRLARAADAVAEATSGALPETYLADLSVLSNVAGLAVAVAERHDRLDVLINNAGIFKTAQPLTDDGRDLRFVVNTLAPCLLTRRLMPLLRGDGRVVNLSSAAQAPVDIEALAGRARVADDFGAYAQSKLALTMWSRAVGRRLRDSGPLIVAVNPGSLLGSKMVTEGFGVAGGDIAIGADILARAALSEEFEDAAGAYFDNDSGAFAEPHADALDERKVERVVVCIESMVAAVA